jgi:hypothetical protein
MLGLFLLAATLPQSHVPPTILVHDYAGLKPAVVDQMAATAAEILGQAGVPTGWVQCGAGQSTACPERLAPTDLVIRIIAKAPLSGVHGEPFGLALMGEEGVYATLFANRVFEIAAMVHLPPGRLLGYAAAHEIGHLLLGPRSHSWAGLMRGRWEQSDLEAMGRGWLLFQAAEAERMRREIQRRGALLAATMSPP